MVKRNIHKFRFTKNENTTPNEEDCLILTNSDLIEQTPIYEVELNSFAETGFFLDTVTQHSKVIYTDGVRKKVLKDRYNNTQGLTYMTLTPNDLDPTSHTKPFEDIDFFDFKKGHILHGFSVKKVFYKEGNKIKEL